MIVGFEWVVMIAVSSAYVLRIVLVVSGMSAVYICIEMGPGYFPGEPPAHEDWG